MTSCLSPSDNESVKTIETTLEVKLRRTETVGRIRCSQCPETAEVHKVEISPPSSLGSAVTFHRVPDGWWVHGGGFWTVKATCPGCFGRPFAGVIDEGPRASGPDPSRDARLSTGEDDLRMLRTSLQEPGSSEPRRDGPVDAPVWQSMLSTPGGVGAIAKALALHLRETITAAGPGEITECIRHGTSLVRIAETLEAAGARLEEFRPKGAADVDLMQLGTQPFATDVASRLFCSFCAKDQKDVQKLIAGPCVYICDECIALSQSIIDEDSPERRDSSSGKSTAPDVLDRIDRVCGSGGSASVSGIERHDDTVERYASVTLRNAAGAELTARGEGDTAVEALRAALAKAGL